jgi:hypothetical protein
MHSSDLKDIDLFLGEWKKLNGEYGNNYKTVTKRRREYD